MQIIFAIVLLVLGVIVFISPVIFNIATDNDYWLVGLIVTIPIGAIMVDNATSIATEADN